MRDIIEGEIKELENVKTIRGNNSKLWVRKMYVGNLLNIKAKRTSTINLKPKTRKKLPEIKLRAKRQSNIYISSERFR